ncbi:MAG: EsaB/YukD family protein [Clostridiales Family XIII bacterium]|jgi:hypothetical protein|nr:EsaB/YukD family protein [Clostridiales Family XIII bacterium]
MPEYFIVTISDGRFEIDLEIPSRLPFTAFKEKLLEILKNAGGHEFLNYRDYRLVFGNHSLRGGDTLASVGAFDGSLLSVRKV